MTHIRILVVGALALLATACGDGSPSADSGDSAAQTVQITMRDITFEPKSIDVASGDTVRFVVTNKGKLAHDAFIGDSQEQAKHETEMRDAEDGDHGQHAGEEDSKALTVEPGRSGTLTHTFDEGGTVEIGCHQPGHYQAGMTVAVTVG